MIWFYVEFKRTVKSMIRYKVDVLKVLKDHGYSQLRLQRENILAGSQIMRLNRGEPIAFSALNKICLMCNLQPGDLIEVVPTEEEKRMYNILSLDNND